MITPSFTCCQDDCFVMVKMNLSAHCKVSEAQFDICDEQFTFCCHPYYLRLVFSGPSTNDLYFLAEGKGERATFDLATNELTVFLPKLHLSVEFPDLDFPQKLIATRKQRSQMKLVTPLRNDESDDDDTEFIQTLPLAISEPSCEYGFRNQFRNFFGVIHGSEGSIRNEIVDLTSPDTTDCLTRRQMREADENSRFDEEFVVDCMLDTDGSVSTLLDNFRPWYVISFEGALKQERESAPVDGKVLPTVFNFTQHSSLETVQCVETGTKVSEDARETETLPSRELHSNIVSIPIWEGNVGTFEKQNHADDIANMPSLIPQLGTLPDDFLCSHQTNEPPHHSPRFGLACPNIKPSIVFTQNELGTLVHLQENTSIDTSLMSRSEEVQHVYGPLVDILSAYCYDHITSSGDGCSESVWNLSKLSPTMSWLQPPANIREACIAFCRRVMVFPFHRHFGLALRCLRDAGILLMCGRGAVVKALLHVKDIFDHSETKHGISLLWINPLIKWIVAQDNSHHNSNQFSRINHTLENISEALHCVVRGTDSNSALSPLASLEIIGHTSNSPLSIMDLRLPISLDPE